MMVKETNQVGPFARLKVSNARGKSFSIFVPRGSKNEAGWRDMATLLLAFGVRTRLEDKSSKRMVPGDEAGRRRKASF